VPVLTSVPAFGRLARGIAVAVASLGLALSVGVGGSGAASSKALAQAKMQLLKLSDLPQGWTAQKSSGSSGGSFPGQARMAACLGVPTSTIALNPPSVNSPEFDNKTVNETVTESIAVFSSATVAQREYAAVASPRTPGCDAKLLNGPLKRQLQASFAAGTTVGKITVTKDSISGLSGFTSSFTVKTQGARIALKLTSLFALKGNEGMQLQFTSVGGALPAALERQLTTVAVGRL
jgi:hypothetical protein